MARLRTSAHENKLNLEQPTRPRHAPQLAPEGQPEERQLRGGGNGRGRAPSWNRKEKSECPFGATRRCCLNSLGHPRQRFQGACGPAACSPGDADHASCSAAIAT
eukprot:4986113-Pyramimonas_sp.AAC.1